MYSLQSPEQDNSPLGIIKRVLGWVLIAAFGIGAAFFLTGLLFIGLAVAMAGIAFWGIKRAITGQKDTPSYYDAGTEPDSDNRPDQEILPPLK